MKRLNEVTPQEWDESFHRMFSNPSGYVLFTNAEGQEVLDSLESNAKRNVPESQPEQWQGEFPKNETKGVMWAGEVPKQKADYKQVSGDHYVKLAMQPWEVMQAMLTPEEFRGFLKGSIIKYSIRQGRKEGSDDGNKARHYIQKLKEVM